MTINGFSSIDEIVFVCLGQAQEIVGAMSSSQIR